MPADKPDKFGLAPSAEQDVTRDEGDFEREKSLVADFNLLMDATDDTILNTAKMCRLWIEALKFWRDTAPILMDDDIEFGEPLYKLGIWQSGYDQKKHKDISVDERAEKFGIRNVTISFPTLMRKVRSNKLFPDDESLSYPYYAMGKSTDKESGVDPEVELHYTIQFLHDMVGMIFDYLSALESSTTRTTYFVPLPENYKGHQYFSQAIKVNNRLMWFVKEYQTDWEGFVYRYSMLKLELYPKFEIDEKIDTLLVLFQRVLAPYEKVFPHIVRNAATKTVWRRRATGAIGEDVPSEAGPGGAFGAAGIPPEYLPGLLGLLGGAQYNVHRGAQEQLQPREEMEGDRE